MTNESGALLDYGKTESESVSYGEIDSWGPFRDYQIVTTPHGDFGLPAKHLLTFETVQRLNKETQQLEEVPQPIWTPVRLDDPRTEPLNVDEVEAAAATAPNVEAAAEARREFNVLEAEKDEAVNELADTQKELQSLKMQLGKAKKKIAKLESDDDE